MNRMRLNAAAMIVFVFLFSGTAFGAELIVSAAASLTDAFTDIKPAFEKAHPGTTVLMNFASSGSCYRQIEMGAPADVFASANPKWMNKAEAGKFVLPGTRRNFARNSLVLAVPADNPAAVGSVRDLLNAGVGKVAVGTPATVPAGQYARGALEKDGLWSALESRFIYAESVRQVLDYLKRGEVDAGFVYATDAVKGGDRVRVVAEIPLEKPVTYPVAVLKGTAHGQEAQTFLDFLAGPEGKALLKKEDSKSTDSN